MQQNTRSLICPECKQPKLMSGQHRDHNPKKNGKMVCVDCYVEWLIEKQRILKGSLNDKGN